jgi:hypothetical protein
VTYEFGRGSGEVLQYAYTVPDIDSAAQAWADRLGVGPWFVRGPFSPPDARYRGEPTTMTVSLARAFSGTTMLELVQQHDDEPSVYRETIDAVGYGFHHYGVGVDDFETSVATNVAAGYDVAFSDTVPNGARIAYLDTTSALPGMLEIIEMTPGQHALYTAIYRACLDWDGLEPVRQGDPSID